MKPRILIVEDEDKLRRVLELELRSADFDVDQAATAEDGLKLVDRADLVLTDLRLPGIDGLELIRLIRRQNTRTPILIMTAFGSVETAVEAMKAGAADFLEKPFKDEVLLDAVRHALESAPSVDGELKEKIAGLSMRERQVLERLVQGAANKVIARDLGISDRTVEIYRAKVMTKMGADSFAELIRMAMLAGIKVENP